MQGKIQVWLQNWMKNALGDIRSQRKDQGRWCLLEAFLEEMIHEEILKKVVNK